MLDRITKSVSAAAEDLRAGKLVAIPTETVYGLAARYDSEKAIEKIFKTKSRPHFDPLIVHCFSVEQAKKITKPWPMLAEQLAKAFWPGPMTLVLPKKEVSDLITSGLETVGVRIPEHPRCLSLLEALDVPLAAPSANRFGKLSPTSVEHVLQEFPSEDFKILEGGRSEIGIESTVIRVFENSLKILRPGKTTESEIKNLVGDKVDIQSTSSHESPGHLKVHYQADKELKIVEWDEKVHAGVELILEEDPLLCARRVYAKLRDLSEQNVEFIYVRKKPSQVGELWDAIWDRLEKSAGIEAQTISTTGVARKPSLD